MAYELPHRRRNLLTGEWLLVSPHRAQRPWQGERSDPVVDARARHDADCYLCPGNERKGGNSNPDYTGCFVFPNDFPALMDGGGGAAADAATIGGLVETHPLFQSHSVRGEARVICYSPDHSASLASLDNTARRLVIDSWCGLSAELGARWDHVQIFENRGAMMGASSPHPHGQVWASDFTPALVQQEDARQRDYSCDNGRRSLLDAVTEAEIADGQRIITSNDHWLVVVPHWAAWPFETLLIARGDVARLEDLGTVQRAALADILGVLLGCYDDLFQCEFPYSMGWHGAPHQLGEDCRHWRLHAHFYPPLLRSASVRKHMVGFELLAETQRDLTPEAAAQRLRECIA